MANVNYQQSNSLQQSLRDLYQPSEYHGLMTLNREEDKARAASMEDYANRGMYSTGAGAQAINKTVGDNYAVAKGNVISGINNNIAAQVGDLTRQIQQQGYEDEVRRQARKTETDDFLRNTLFNVAGIFVNPLSKGIGYNLMKSVAPNMLQDSLGSYFFPQSMGMGPFTPATMAGAGTGTQQVNPFIQMLMQYLFGGGQAGSPAPAAAPAGGKQ